jgi:hypothetical protein
VTITGCKLPSFCSYYISRLTAWKDSIFLKQYNENNMKTNEQEVSEKMKLTPQEIWDANSEKSYEELLQWVKDNSIETAALEIKNVEKR